MTAEQNDLGSYLRTLRNNKGQTLHQVAMQIDIDSPMLSKIERGQRLPTMEQLIKLSKHFKVKKEDLQILFTAKKILKVFGANETTYKAVSIVQSEIAHNNLGLKAETTKRK